MTSLNGIGILSGSPRRVLSIDVSRGACLEIQGRILQIPHGVESFNNLQRREQQSSRPKIYSPGGGASSAFLAAACAWTAVHASCASPCGVPPPPRRGASSLRSRCGTPAPLRCGTPAPLRRGSGAQAPLPCGAPPMRVAREEKGVWPRVAHGRDKVQWPRLL